MSNAPRIVYQPREDASPEGELAALAAVYSFVLRCAEVRLVEQAKASGGDSGEDGRPDLRPVDVEDA